MGGGAWFPLILFDEWCWSHWAEIPPFGDAQHGPCVPAVALQHPLETRHVSRATRRQPPSPGHQVLPPPRAVAVTERVLAGCGARPTRSHSTAPGEPLRTASPPSAPRAPFPVPIRRFQALTLSINKGEGEGGWLAC